MKVIIQKPDLDTCLTALIMGVSEKDEIVVSKGGASTDDLHNPSVLCIEAGGSGDVHLNNFDHHNTDTGMPPACRQAYDYRASRISHMLSENLGRLVEYVCMVDDEPKDHPPIEFPSLSNIFSGMLLVERDPIQQFLKGIAIIKKVLESNIDPFNTMPDIEEWRAYRIAKEENIKGVKEAIKNAEFYTARNGYKVGFLESKYIGGIGALYNQGCDVVVMFNPTYGNPPVHKWTIAGNGRDVYHLIESFDKIEKGWGGRATIIGSPREGTGLKKEEVMSVVLNNLKTINETIHIITVGTSLVTNKGRPEKEKKIIRDEKEKGTIEELNKISEDVLSLKQGSDYKKLLQQFVSKLQRLNIEHEMNLSLNRKEGQRNRFSQELTYLYLRLQEIKGKPVKEKVYLLPTNTIVSKFSAYATKEFIERNNEWKRHFQVEIKVLEKVEFGGDNVTLKEQADEVYEIIGRIMEENRSAQKIHIDIAGGLKSLAPYILIQGMLYSPKVILHHVLPQREKDTTLPTYPLGVDFHHYHKNAKRLEMVLRGKEWYKTNLSEQMKNLIDKNRLSILGEQFKQRYEEQSKKAKIEVYSKEIVGLLLGDASDEKVQTYRRILENVIDKSGAYIWTGDKIPEMVEHAKRHHHDLLEFTEMFLTPILAVNKDFLNPAERFCLLAGVLLHDCGHSIDYINTTKYGRVPLFASEIRELHHILAVQRLKDKKLREDLGWPSKKEFKEMGLDEKLYDAVMDVCMYHRKKMPFSNGCFRHPFVGEFGPLSKKKYNGIDIMKITALLRIIDSCDIKSSRPGSEEEVKIALNLFKKDYKTLKIKAENAYEIYEYLCKDKAMNANNKLKQGCRYIDKTKMMLKDNYIDRIKCLEALKNSSKKLQTLARAWLTAAELIDKASMKKRQDKHYEKHLYLKEVMVMPSKNFSEKSFNFDITLCPVEGVTGDKKEIEKELIAEYKEVKNYLCKIGISLTYRWHGNGPFYSAKGG